MTTAPPGPRENGQTGKQANAETGTSDFAPLPLCSFARGRGAGGGPESLMALLQISDSAFPSGTFTHSFGLEQLVRDGYVRKPTALEAFVDSVLRQSTSTADVVAMRRGWSYAAEWDLDGIVEADRSYMRTKTASELRTASLVTGRRLIEETAVHVEDELLQSYATMLREDRRLGMHPIAFGVVGCVLGVSEADCASALLQTTANAILQASMRLMPISHRDVQGILHRLRPEIASLGMGKRANGQAGKVGAPEPKMRSFHPLQEIASMRHARGNSRLFSS